jgi:hypothetical protein
MVFEAETTQKTLGCQIDNGVCTQGQSKKAPIVRTQTKTK